MTDTTRDLIQRLADELQVWIDNASSEFNDPFKDEQALIDDARAFLDQPEPDVPTDEELHDLWLELYGFHPDGPTSGDVAVIARAVLARWGRPTTPTETP